MNIEETVQEWIQDDRPAWQTIEDFENRIECVMKPLMLDLFSQRSVEEMIKRELVNQEGSLSVARPEEA